MPANSSIEHGPVAIGGRTWFTALLSWPIEVVINELEVVAPRELSVMEWAVGSILDLFSDLPPTLTEAATELGIDDRAPLETVLRELIGLGAVENQSPAGTLDLARCHLTPVGAALLREGRVGGHPERHGMSVYFDAVTGEALTAPPHFTKVPVAREPIAASALPPRRTEIGLDLVRHLSQERGEPFHQGESRIAGARVRPEDGHHVWTKRRIELGFDADGMLQGSLVDGSQDQLVWWRKHGPPVIIDLARNAGPAWANEICTQPPAQAEAWLADVESLVAPVDIADHAVGLIADAAAEVVVHHAWRDGLELTDALIQAARRGVRCYVCGTDAPLSEWTSRPTGPGFLVGTGSLAGELPLAIVVDGQSALSIRRICTSVESGPPIEVLVAARIKSAHVETLRSDLLRQTAESLGVGTREQLFAVFGAERDLGRWVEGAQRIWSDLDGLDRVQAQREWAQWGQAVSLSQVPAEGWWVWTVRSWHAAAESDENVIDLLEGAVGLMEPGHAVQHLCSDSEPVSALEDVEPLCDLLELAQRARRVWPEFNPVSDCPVVKERIAASLHIGDAQIGEATAQAVEHLARQPRFQASASAWSALLSSALPAPVDLESLVEWLEAHVPLQPFLGSWFARAATQYRRKLIDQSISPTSSAVRALYERAWAALELPVSGDRRSVMRVSARPVAAPKRRIHQQKRR